MSLLPGHMPGPFHLNAILLWLGQILGSPPLAILCQNSLTHVNFSVVPNSTVVPDLAHDILVL
jgi:hypothetical protein